MKLQITPIIKLTLALLVGIILGRTAVPYISIRLWELLALCILWYFAMLISYFKNYIKSFGLAAILLFCTLGAFLFQYKYNSVRFAITSDIYHVSGIIDSQPVRKAKTWAIRLKTGNGHIMAYFAPDKEIKKGDSIELFSPYGLEPTCNEDNPDSTFHDYHNHLFYSGISATVYSPSGCWNVIGHPRQNGLVSCLKSIQTVMVSQYAEAGFKGDEGAIITAITTGDKSQLTDTLRQQYSRAGVAHVLALSGFHLNIIYAILEWVLLLRFASIRWRNIIRIITILLLTSFTIMAGSPPSLIRALIMISIMIVCNILQRDNLSMNSLFLAASLMLMANPMMLFDVGFQLSFMSMFGLLSIDEPLYGLLHVRKRVSRYFWGAICSTTICTLFTMPLITYYFGYVSLVSLVSNLVVPLLAIIMMSLSIVWWITALVPAIQIFIGNTIIYITHQMNSFTEWLSSFEWAVLPFQSTLAGVVLQYLLIAAVIYLLSIIYKRMSFVLKQ